MSADYFQKQSSPGSALNAGPARLWFGLVIDPSKGNRKTALRVRIQIEFLVSAKQTCKMLVNLSLSVVQ